MNDVTPIELLGCLLIAVFALLAIALGAGKTPTCAVCGAPIYRTSAGYRHKPGHAPRDGHHALLAERPPAA